jgi:RNA polymerase sigma factor (sigma-70 family)
MTDSKQEFQQLLEGVREGDDDAARALVERYGPHVLRVVRRKLDKRLRSKFDSADFLQAVWASFFAIPDQKFTFNESGALVAFLVTLARNKVVEAVRQRLQTQKHDVHREESLDAPGPHEEAHLPGREPTPSAIAIAREEWQRVLQKQPAHYQCILHSRREGQSPRQIAEELGVSERTVRRVIRKLGSGTPHE